MEITNSDQSQSSLAVAWQHDKELPKCMIELYDKEMWTDVKIRCKNHSEEERIHAHKIVLAARSPVFQASFFGPFAVAESKDDIHLDQVDANILDLLLRYLYSDETKLNEDTAPAVLEAAHFYQVTKLVQYSADYLATVLTTENACRFLTLALKYQVTSLRDAASAFIDDSADEILESEEFFDSSEECLRYILKGDTFYAEEDTIFRNAEEWAVRKLTQKQLETTGRNIREVLGDTFFDLRLPTMTYETLMECIRGKEFFSIHKYESILDHLHKIYGSSVECNSCVERLPQVEKLNLDIDMITEDTQTVDNVSTSFKISINRDIRLSSVGFTNIKPYLEFGHICYKNNTITSYYRQWSQSLEQFISEYRGKAIKFESPYSVNELLKFEGQDLSSDCDILIFGELTITNSPSINLKLKEDQRNESEDEQVRELIDDDFTDEEEENNDDFMDACDDFKANVVFEQIFELPSSKVSDDRMDLKEPVLLTKKLSPYTVSLKLQYSNWSNMKMKVPTGPISKDCENGQFEVEDIEGTFAGISYLEFQNVSNRETLINQ